MRTEKGGEGDFLGYGIAWRGNERRNMLGSVMIGFERWHSIVGFYTRLASII